ncbi:MAG: hypothetical protein JRG76_05405 [Deltaproteobacteria bacterium]|nr:hypothetical protein [Deltaproteobacteria bacterium]MBW2413930.1 hypothetical protein [Deltaproteobacteria bacterium]
MLRHLFMGAASFLAVAFISVPYWIAVQRRDLPDPGDADLQVVRSSVSPDSNGFTWFSRASEAVVWDPVADDALCSEEWCPDATPGWVADRVAANAAAFEDIERGLRAPVFQFPSLAPGDRSGVDGADEWSQRVSGMYLSLQRLARLSGTAARLDARAGRRDRAIERALLGMRMGRALSRAEGVDLIAAMFAAGLQRISAGSIEAVARAAPLDAAASVAWIDRIETQRWTSDDWRRVWAAEYQFLKRALEGVETDDAGAAFAVGERGAWAGLLLGWMPRDYLWQPNRTMALAARKYRERQRLSALDCRSADVLRRQTEVPFDRAGVLASPNPVGNILMEIAQPNFDRFDLRRCGVEARLSLVQVLIATKAFHDTHGGLPESLDALVPEFMTRVPQDALDGEPIRYSREAARTWSTGEDFVEASAHAAADPRNPAEPALSLAF